VIVVPGSSMQELKDSGTNPPSQMTSSRSRDQRVAAPGHGCAIAKTTSAPASVAGRAAVA
jgi:hypothetical protein